MTTIAMHAIRAAKNIPNWGINAAAKYAKNNGVPIGTLLVAIKCERTERRREDRLPMFLVNQSY